MKGKVAVIVTVVAAVIVAGAVMLRPGGPDKTVTIGGKQFTEQEILGEIMAGMIEAHSGIEVKRRLNLGGTMICFNALDAGDLDMYAEYTGTGLVNILKEEVVPDPEKAYTRVREAFKEKYRLAWLEPFGFNNTYTLTMREERAKELGIETLSDLAGHFKSGKTDLTAAFDAEFHTRPDGYKGVCEHYGFQFPETPRQMDSGLMYKACADGAVDIIDAFATDGRIAAYGLKVLEDDENFFPPYYAAPLVRMDTLENMPELRGILNQLGGHLTNKTMQELNYAVDEKGRKASDVAREFLLDQGLVEDKDAGKE